MRILVFSIIGLFWVSTVAGQGTNRFSFDFGYGINLVAMDNLNVFYIDSFAGNPTNDIYRDHLKRGQHFNFGVNYSPIRWLSIGVFGDYHYASLKSYKWYNYFDDKLEKNTYTKQQFELRPESWGVGLESVFYFSELIFSKEKEQRIHFGIELKGGVNFTKITTVNILLTNYTADNSKVYYNKNNISGQLGLKIEYDFTQTPIFTTLGLRAGYQFLKSGTARDAADQEWLINDKYPINLDFSGFYFGVYLKLGK